MDDKTALSDMVRTRRKALNMSQSVLAQACGIGERTIMRVEAGERVSTETLMAICSVLGIAPHVARAAMEEASPAIELLPSFGPLSDSSKAIGLRNLRSLHPEASVFACGDAAAALASEEGSDWLRRVAGVRKGFVPRDETEMRVAVRSPSSLARRLLLSSEKVAVRGIGETAWMFLVVVGSIVATAALGAATLGAGYLIGPLAPSLLLFGLVAGLFTLMARSDRDLQRINDLLTIVVAASPDMVSFAKGGRRHDFDARSCVEATIKRTLDGRHVTIAMKDVFGVSKTARWLPAHPDLIGALEAFRAKVATNLVDDPESRLRLDRAGLAPVAA